MHLNLQSTEVQIWVWVEMLRIIKEYLRSTYNEIGGRKLSHAWFVNFGSSFSFFKVVYIECAIWKEYFFWLSKLHVRLFLLAHCPTLPWVLTLRFPHGLVLLTSIGGVTPTLEFWYPHGF